MATAKAAMPKAPGSLLEILRRIKRYWYCYLMILGTSALVGAFCYYPAASAIYHRLTIWQGFGSAQWVGLRNYREIFASEVIFRRGFLNMGILALWEVVRTAIFPLLVAQLIYRLRSERSAHYFRLLFVLPIVVPGIVTILIWREFLEPNTGLVNALLGFFGIGPLSWLNGRKTALVSLMLVNFPWVSAIDMLIFLAGLLAIPGEVIEASIVDGAGSWRRFFSIELPLIVPQMRLIVVLTTISALQSFSWQLLITQGGPSHATTVPAWEMYSSAMVGTRFGLASAIGVVLFVLILVLTLINNASIRSGVEYQAKN